MIRYDGTKAGGAFIDIEDGTTRDWRTSFSTDSNGDFLSVLTPGTYYFSRIDPPYGDDPCIGPLDDIPFSIPQDIAGVLDLGT